MEELEFVGLMVTVGITLLGGLGMIVKPVKSNTKAMTKLDVTNENLNKTMDRLNEKLDAHEDRLNDHEQRLVKGETEIEQLKYDHRSHMDNCKRN